MKRELISIVTVALLACGSTAAQARPLDGCDSDGQPISESHGIGVAARPLESGHAQRSQSPCSRFTRTGLLVRVGQTYLSDKQIERALKKHLRGRMIDAKFNAARMEYTVLWEERQGGKRKLRKLIVDAKTGRVKREIRSIS